MSPDPLLYLFVSLRSLHVLVAALWLGSAALLFWFVMPAAGNLAPETVARLARRKLHAFMPSVAGTTVLSGLLLYWHLTGFSATGMSSHAGIAFGIGGALGLAAMAIGGGVVGKSAAKVAELYASAEGARSGQTSAAIDLLVRRMAGAGRIVIALLLAALILMTLGHYV
jgi:alanine dehydrogenase